MAWPQELDLSEGWTAAGLSALGEETGDPIDVSIPHQWTNDPRFAGVDNAVRYRREFQATRSTKRTTRALPERHWLQVHGCFYACELAINERPVDHREGYFIPQTFCLDDISDGKTNDISLDVRCDAPHDRRTKRQLTGVFQHNDAIASDFNPGGLWREITYVRTGPAAFSRFRVLCTSADELLAMLNIRAVVSSDTSRRVRMRTTLNLRGSKEVVSETFEEFDLSEGDNRIKWQIAVRDPKLWWPHGYGDQPLYDVQAEIFVAAEDGAAVVSDLRKITTGLRTVESDDFVFKVNGQKLFLRGTNYLPTNRVLSAVTAEQTKADIKLAQDLGLNMMRVFGHVAHPSLYEAADQLGMLLWQDMPMVWGHSSSVRSQATLQARELVNYYGQHPSIITWLGHNQPIALDEHDSRDRSDSQAHARYIVRQQVPTFSRTVLGTLVRRAFEDADSTRPIFAHSGVLPHLGARGSDTHTFIGFDRGRLDDFSAFLSRVPTLARFVGAFGAQSAPTTDGFLPVSRWPMWNWDDIAQMFGANLTALQRNTPVEAFKNFQQWKVATQELQANLMRHHIERIRLLKYRPSGGFAFSYLADAQPAISMSLFDYERIPKLAVDVVREACQPIVAIMDWPDNEIAAGSDVELGVYVVNDMPTSIGDSVVSATVEASGETFTWKWAGEITADCTLRVGTIAFVAPQVAGGVDFSITLESPSGNSHTPTRTYTSAIVDSI